VVGFGAWSHDLEVLPGVVDAVSWLTAGGSQRQPQPIRQVTAGGNRAISRSVQVRFPRPTQNQLSHPAQAVLAQRRSPSMWRPMSVDRGASYARRSHRAAHVSRSRPSPSLQEQRQGTADQKAAAIRVQIGSAQQVLASREPITRTTPAKTSSNTTNYRWSWRTRSAAQISIWAQKLEPLLPWP